MAVIPTVPNFVTSETPSIAKLNQLASAVTFIYALPAFAQLTGSGQSIPNGGTGTALTWSAPGTDRDGGWAAGNPTRYTANTPGYYQCDTLANFLAPNNADRSAWFRVTTGTGNPGGAGNVTRFGYADTSATTSGNAALTLAAMTPYLYAGDYIEVIVMQTGAVSNTGSCSLQVSLASLGP